MTPGLLLIVLGLLVVVVLALVGWVLWETWRTERGHRLLRAAEQHREAQRALLRKRVK